MEEMSGKVQNASSHRSILRTHKAHGQFSGAMEEMSRGFKMQTLTYCDATFMSTRTAAGQFKGQFKGAMERFICGFEWHKHSPRPANKGAGSE